MAFEITSAIVTGLKLDSIRFGGAENAGVENAGVDLYLSFPYLRIPLMHFGTRVFHLSVHTFSVLAVAPFKTHCNDDVIISVR